jgi:hypothetical protein
MECVVALCVYAAHGDYDKIVCLLRKTRRAFTTTECFEFDRAFSKTPKVKIRTMAVLIHPSSEVRTSGFDVGMMHDY